MHEKIKDIQNSFWKAYTDFNQTKDMKQYNDAIAALTQRYRHERTMLNFCKSLSLAWAPVINGMKEWS